MTEERAAFYALEPGGWRDYWSLLHPPYTIWHLSYVVMGAAIAPQVRVRWLLETLAAFFLAMGIAAHALDELHGRPLKTRIPSAVLVSLAVGGLAGAVAFGIHGAAEQGAWLWLFIVVGVFLVGAYNLEPFGGLFHSDLVFSLAWGAFPVLTASFAQTGRVSWGAVALAGACALISAAQRVLSTPVRHVRRQVLEVEGQMRLAGGGSEPIDASSLTAAPERALKLMSLAVPLLAAGMLAVRL